MTYEIAYTINNPGHHTHGEKRSFRGGNNGGIKTLETANGLAAVFATQDDMADVTIVVIPAGWAHTN